MLRLCLSNSQSSALTGGLFHCVLYILYMTSIPDSISRDELLRIQVNAEPDFVPAESVNQKQYTPEEMSTMVQDAVETLTDKFGTMFGYKLTAMYCLGYMKTVHDDAAIASQEQGDIESMLGWARDGDKCQAAYGTLVDIYCGPQDFTCKIND